MAKMMNKKERRARKLVAKAARGALGAMELKEAVTSPHTFATKEMLKKAAKADKVPMRRGLVRDRYQVYNSRTGRWVKINAKTGRIVGVKKDGLPYKGVRKKR